MKNPDHELRNHFWVKILKFFDADPGSRMEKFGSGMEKVGSGIQDKQPGSATQLTGTLTGVALVSGSLS
jgi:hypothetical protein